MVSGVEGVGEVGGEANSVEVVEEAEGAAIIDAKLMLHMTILLDLRVARRYKRT